MRTNLAISNQGDASRLESDKSHKRHLKRLLLAIRSQSDASRLESCKSHKRRVKRLLLSQFGGVCGIQ